MSLFYYSKLAEKPIAKRQKDYLASLIQDDEARDNLLHNLMDGTYKALKVKEANTLLRIVLLSLIVNDGQEEIEIIPATQDSGAENEIPEEEYFLTFLIHKSCIT